MKLFGVVVACLQRVVDCAVISAASPYCIGLESTLLRQWMAWWRRFFNLSLLVVPFGVCLVGR